MNLTRDGWFAKKNRQLRAGLGLYAEGAPMKLNY
jgi:hypothetical protein